MSFIPLSWILFGIFFFAYLIEGAEEESLDGSKEENIIKNNEIMSDVSDLRVTLPPLIREIMGEQHIASTFI